MKQQHTVLGGLIRPVSEAPIHYKQMLRLIRRAREHDVYLDNLVHGKDHVTVFFFANTVSFNPGRVIRIRDDGTMIPEILKLPTPQGPRNDPLATSKRIHDRLSWQELNWAGYCRSQGWKVAARATLRFARHDRLHAECAA